MAVSPHYKHTVVYLAVLGGLLTFATVTIAFHTSGSLKPGNVAVRLLQPAKSRPTVRKSGIRIECMSIEVLRWGPESGPARPSSARKAVELDGEACERS